MSYGQERVRHGLEKLRDEIQANIDAEKGIKKPPVPAPSIDQLREHYAKYDLAFTPKANEEAA
jgi:hypothetical protein